MKTLLERFEEKIMPEPILVTGTSISRDLQEIHDLIALVYALKREVGEKLTALRKTHPK